MNKMIIADAMGHIDDSFINEVIERIEEKKGARTGNKGKWIALAVSAAAVIALGLILYFKRPTGTDVLPASDKGGESQEGSAISGKNTETSSEQTSISGKNTEASSEQAVTAEPGTETGIHIPAIERPEEDALSDMMQLVVYHGRIYTEYGYNEYDEDVMDLIGEYVGEATGSIDEWSTKSDYENELAGTFSGSIYTVKGYDPDFRLCNVISYSDEQGRPKKVVFFLENLNGITLESGADLFEERLQIRGHVKELLYESHDGRNNGSKVSIPLDMTANQKSWDTFLDELDSGTFIEIDNVNDIGLYDSERQADLFIKKDDGTTVVLRLFEGGYVGYRPLGGYFIKMPGEAFDAIYAACGGK